MAKATQIVRKTTIRITPKSSSTGGSGKRCPTCGKFMSKKG